MNITSLMHVHVSGGAESKGRDDKMLSDAAAAQPRLSDSGHHYEELNEAYSPQYVAYTVISCQQMNCSCLLYLINWK